MTKTARVYSSKSPQCHFQRPRQHRSLDCLWTFLMDKSHNIRSLLKISIIWASESIREEEKVEMMIWQLVEWCWLARRRRLRKWLLQGGGNLPVGRRQARGQHSGLLLSLFPVIFFAIDIIIIIASWRQVRGQHSGLFLSRICIYRC